MLAARASSLSLVVHAVDDAGAACGSLPARGRGWRLSSLLPVNCPQCLLALRAPRYALCETPTASSASPWHVRRVGIEGVCKSGNPSGSRTLCNVLVGWDNELMRGSVATAGVRVCETCARIFETPGLESVRDFVVSARS